MIRKIKKRIKKKDLGIFKLKLIKNKNNFRLYSDEFDFLYTDFDGNEIPEVLLWLESIKKDITNLKISDTINKIMI